MIQFRIIIGCENGNQTRTGIGTTNRCCTIFYKKKTTMIHRNNGRRKINNKNKHESDARNMKENFTFIK